MSWNTIVGHEGEVQKLRDSCAAGGRAHAYAFVGHSGIGKKRFAVELAQCLLCEKHTDGQLESCGECPSCRQVAAGTHPDLLSIAILEGKRELVVEQFI